MDSTWSDFEWDNDTLLIATEQNPTYRSWCAGCVGWAGTGLGQRSLLEDLLFGCYDLPHSYEPDALTFLRSILLAQAQVGPAVATKNFPWLEHVHGGPCDCLNLPWSAFLVESKGLHACREREQARMYRPQPTVSWMAGAGCSVQWSYGAGWGLCGLGAMLGPGTWAGHRQDERDLPGGGSLLAIFISFTSSPSFCLPPWGLNPRSWHLCFPK